MTNETMRPRASQCTESTVWAKTQTAADATVASPYIVCQATRLPYATTSLEWWDIRQYIEDYVSGNVGLWRIVCGAAYFLFHAHQQRCIEGPVSMLWLYDSFIRCGVATPFPRKHGTIPEGRTDASLKTLDLQPGELVRIKPLPRNSRRR